MIWYSPQTRSAAATETQPAHNMVRTWFNSEEKESENLVSIESKSEFESKSENKTSTQYGQNMIQSWGK